MTAAKPSIVIDVDDTLCWPSAASGNYAEALPRQDVINRLREYADAGFSITLFTARNMRSFERSVGRITAITVPVLVDWLRAHDVPFDEIHVGKPWPGPSGFYVDDRAIRPSEFLRLSHDEILNLLLEEKE